MNDVKYPPIHRIAPITENYLAQIFNNAKIEKLCYKSITVLGTSYVANKYLKTLWGESHLPAESKKSGT